MSACRSANTFDGAVIKSAQEFFLGKEREGLMSDLPRDSGIKILGRVPWGTHFCQFYQTQKDLLDILVPYFKAGLASNEACLWICSEPLDVADARKALRRAVPGLNRHLRSGQIEILPHTEWYLRKGRFSARRVLNGWIEKWERARARGYDGLRLSGNTFWLEKKNWDAFAKYEEAINGIISRFPMLALCTYSLDRCDAREVMDVMENHQQTLIRKSGKWRMVASSVIKKAQEDLKESQDRFSLFFKKSPIGIVLYDAEGRLIEANASCLKIFGVGNISEIRGFRLFKDPNISREVRAKIRQGHAVRHEMSFDFDKVLRPELCRTSRSGVVALDVQITPISRRPGHVEGYLVQIMDISKRKKAEKALRSAYEEMERRVEERTSELARTVRQLQKEVADRRETEKALSEKSRVLETFLQSTLTSLVFLDKNFNFIRVNEAYARACQRPMSDFPGHNHFEFYPDKENETIFRNVIKTKKPYRALSKPFSYPDHPEWGVTYWDWTLSPVLNDADKVEYLVLSLHDVSEEARAHEELRKSEALLRNVLETLPIGVWITDKQGRIIISNPAGQKIWAGTRHIGIEPDGRHKGRWANTGKTIEPEEWAAARALTKGETSINEEVEIECFDGTRKFILNSALPIRDPDNAIAGAIIINQDITARRKIETALRTASAYTRGLIEASLDPLVTISSEGKITDVNRATEIATGIPRTLLIGTDFSTYFTEPGKARRGYQEVFLKGEVRDYPLAIRHTSGNVTEVLYNAVIYKNDAGEVIGVFAAARDITKLQAAEQERLRLAAAIEQLIDGIAIMDLKGRILSANPAFREHHPLRQKELSGRSLPEILQIDGQGREIIKKMNASLSAGKIWSWRITQQTARRKFREIDLSVSPILDGNRRLIHSIAVSRDITQEVQLQERIRQWQKMEALGTLAGGIAHDFNNVLLPIIINTELILSEEKEGSPTANRLSQILDAARRGKDMVRQIIAFSQQREQDRKPVEIVPIIKETLKLLRISIPKNIDIVEKIHVESAVAVADPTQIQQVLMNLGHNAAHAMREKGGTLEVNLSETSVSAKKNAHILDVKPGAFIRLSVSDSGQGIPPEIMSRIFEPFFTTKKRGEGTGMGLAVVHGIVKSHGGAIAVSSDVGKGAEFTVFLPCISGQAVKTAEGREPYPKGTESILFVDDEDMQVRAMTKLLEHLGYQVVGLTDAAEALEIFQRGPDAFDLAIMDQAMPRLTGSDLARELLRIKPGLPIILCTGYSETLNEDQALAMGIRAFIMKPFSVKEIAENIRRLLTPSYGQGPKALKAGARKATGSAVPRGRMRSRRIRQP